MRMNCIKNGPLWCLLMILTKVSESKRVPAKDHSERLYFAIETDLNMTSVIGMHPDWNYEHEVRGLDNHYVFSKSLTDVQKREFDDNVLLDGITAFHNLPPKRLHKRLPVPDLPAEMPSDSSLIPMSLAKEKLEISDPAFDQQWHLINTNFPGNDVNVSNLWFQNITGFNVVAAIVDDGLDYESEDLRDNFSPEGSWDFNNNEPLPKPRLNDDYHGTRCAGEIAAVKNDVCGIGVAYNAKVSGIRILSGEITSEDEAASLIYGLDVNDIYSCSWGPSDDGRTLQGPDELVKKALVKGVLDGRNKKGAVYVFASGNGGMFDDNCNYDGYTNSIYSITVGAIDHKGLHPPYSEACSAVMVVTYSSGSGEYIHSTDIKGKCSNTHGGTSAAAPLAAGVFALVLEANPDLTWRDMQYLVILSSVEINEGDGNWQHGALGKRYSHRYGYGKLDAYRIVDMARSWTNVNPQSWYYSNEEVTDQFTNSTDTTLESTIEITDMDLSDANLKRVEHITVTVDIETDFRGHTLIDLISPEGITSNLGVLRRMDKSKEGFRDWTFMSVAHWGEKGAGEWKLQVRTTNEGDGVKLNRWNLKIFGESLEASRAQTFSYGDDKDETSIATVSTQASETESLTQIMTSSATDSESSIRTSSLLTAEPTVSTSAASSYLQTSSPSPIPTHDGDDYDTNQANRLSRPADAMHYFVALFILGSAFFLLYFVFFVRSRRRIRRSRAEAYEFDIIDSDSEYDSSMDNATNASANMLGDSIPEDFDFDLSDEELLAASAATSSTPDNKKASNTLDEIIEDAYDDRAPLNASSEQTQSLEKTSGDIKPK